MIPSAPIKRLFAAIALLFPCVLACNAATDGLGTTWLEAKAFPTKGQVSNLEQQVMDLRYAPYRWQACIGLPDDPYKSIVGSDGGLYYDYGGGHFYSFKTRVLAALETEGDKGKIKQRLQDSRIPVVITEQDNGNLMLQQYAWAAAPEQGQTVDQRSLYRADYLWAKMVNNSDTHATGRIAIEVDSKDELQLTHDRRRLIYRNDPMRIFCTIDPACSDVKPSGAPPNAKLTLDHRPGFSRNWAQPKKACAARFHNILVGWNRPLIFTYPAKPDKQYRIAFGLIEGYHPKAGIRPLQIRIEGRIVRSVDLIGDYGRNIPVVIAFDAKDLNEDGIIEMGVYPPENAEDRNTILSGLWIFERENAPSENEILSGAADAQSLALADCDHLAARSNSLKLLFERKTLEKGQENRILLTLYHGQKASYHNTIEKHAASELAKAADYWKSLNLPYDRITVPDSNIQALLDSCIRNIYQAREIKDNRPAFQVGPTCYRGTWAADGPFILEAITYLGRSNEVREGLEQQVDKDQGPDGVEFSKKSGLRLWMIWRHAQLTGDWTWLEKMWPRVEREVNQIISYRHMTMSDPNQTNYGLMPIGFGDGGLGGKHREYTNIYWTLTGFRAAIEMTQRLDKSILSSWQAEYTDYWEYFERARRRDKLTDEHGNLYVPVTMKGEAQQLPQRGAWAFLHSVFPGRIFQPNDELMLGTMAMLDATEKQGLIYGTGWLIDGIWNYAASFYGHAHLWLGHGPKTASTLYAFANHACPLLCWREEQNLIGQNENYCGDMPHNWASAEFIRMVRHMLILERGSQLHLMEALPGSWTKAGHEIHLHKIPTSFGPVSLSVQIASDGNSAKVDIDPPLREYVEKLAVHLEGFGRTIKNVEYQGANLTDGPAKIQTNRTISINIEFGD